MLNSHLQSIFCLCSLCSLTQRQQQSWQMSKHCPPTIDFHLISVSVRCQNALTISIYINPVKHAVGEILRGCFLIFIPIDGTNGLQWKRTKISAPRRGQDLAGKCSVEDARLTVPLWCWGARVCRCSRFHPHHKVWNTSAACAPSFLASPGSELPRTPWSLCSRPAETSREMRFVRSCSLCQNSIKHQ